MRSAAAVMAVAALVALVTGCRSTPEVHVPGPAAPERVCHDLSFSGRFDPAGEEPSRFVRLSLRGCRDGIGPVVFEVRGRVGGAVVAGAVGSGRLLLLFPGDRTAVTGPDEPQVWRRWAGVPLSEQLLRRAVRAPRLSGQRERVGSWSVRIERPGGAQELSIQARSRAGDRLTLELRRRRTVKTRPAWPGVPEGFERVRAATEGGPGVP